MMNTFKVFFITAILLVSNLLPAEFYVDKKGSDSAAGSESAPLQTIQKAASKAGPGDTVIVKSGEYKEVVTINKSGASGAKLTLKAVPSRTVLTGGFIIQNANYVRIEGFSVDGRLAQGKAGVEISGSYNEVVDNYFTEIGMGVNVYSTSKVLEANYIAYNKCYKIQYGIVVSGKNWLVESNEIERLFCFNPKGDCDYTRFFGEDGIFRNNYFHGTKPNEIGKAHVDCWQTFDDNGEYVKNILMEENVCMDCAQGFMGEALKNRRSSGVTFRKNVFAHTWAWGLCVNGITGITAINNTFVDVKIFGIGMGEGSGTGSVIKNNIFYKVGEQAITKVTGAQISYNLFYDAGNAAGANALKSEPQFNSYSNNDFGLRPGSPCVDAGDPSTPVPEKGGKRIDIGASEVGCPDTFLEIPMNGIKPAVEKKYMDPNPADFTKTETVRITNLPDDAIFKIYNARQELILTLNFGMKRGKTDCTGKGAIIWDGMDMKGLPVPAGVYFGTIFDKKNNKTRFKFTISR